MTVFIWALVGLAIGAASGYLIWLSRYERRRSLGFAGWLVLLSGAASLTLARQQVGAFALAVALASSMWLLRRTFGDVRRDQELKRTSV